jgi:hypothetical protein
VNLKIPCVEFIFSLFPYLQKEPELFLITSKKHAFKLASKIEAKQHKLTQSSKRNMLHLLNSFTSKGQPKHHGQNKSSSIATCVAKMQRKGKQCSYHKKYVHFDDESRAAKNAQTLLIKQEKLFGDTNIDLTTFCLDGQPLRRQQ